MTNAIVNFGDRDEIKELSERIQKMLPGGINYTAKEALTLAQISVAHDLDPFNGECWLIKKGTTVYGALIGIKGHRKHAKKQSDYWGEFIRVPKVETYNAPPDSIVYEYHLHDDVTLEKYTNRIERLVKIGYDLEAAQKIVGNPPSTLGIGIYEKGESTKMKPAQCAMFRAEKDALKRRFDVQFRVNIDGQEIPVTANGDGDDEMYADEIEAEYSEEPRDQDEVLYELGFDNSPEPTNERPYAPEILRLNVAKYADDHYPGDGVSDYLRKVIAAQLDAIVDGTENRYKVLSYLTGVQSTMEMPEAFIWSLSKMLNVDDFNDPPNAMAMDELRGVLKEVEQVNAQAELEL